MHRQVAVATIIVCLVTPLFSAVYAQSCPPPTPPPITVQNAEICLGALDSASTTAGYASYAWSATHGSIVSSDASGNVTFSADGSGDVTLAVTVTDGSGCSSSGSTTVSLRTIPPPTLHAYPDFVCPGGFATANVDPPDPNNPYMSWANVHWTVTNGTITSDRGTSVDIATDPGGAAATLTVTVTDTQGCSSTATNSYLVRSIPPPTLHAYPDAICPGGFGSAYIDPPDPNFPYYGWSNVHWTITNGTITNDRGTGIDFTSNPAGGQVTITVTATDNQGCSNSASSTYLVRSIPPPTLHAFPDAICPGGFGSAYIDPPDPNNSFYSWSNVHWTITNGTITNDRGTGIDFTSNPAGGPVTLTVTATDSQGCSNSATTSYLVRSIPPPTLHAFPDAICPGGFGSAYIDPPDPSGTFYSWSNVHWTITNGTITNDRGAGVDFTSDPGGAPVTLTVTATDSQGCSNSATTTYLVRSIPPPVIHSYPDTIITGGNGSAYIDPPPPSGSNMGWSSVHWSISNGTITYDRGTGVDFTTDATSGYVTLTVSVTDNQACGNSASVAIPVQAFSPGSIHLDLASVCLGGYDNATLDQDQNNPWTSIAWSIQNGSILYGQGTTRIGFQADSSGNPVALSVTASNSSGSTQASVSVPIHTNPPPVIQLGDGSCPHTATVANASSFTAFMWTGDGVNIPQGWNDPTVTFYPTRNGHVSLTVRVYDAGGCDITTTYGWDVSGLPDTTISINAPTQCENDHITLSVPDGGPGVTYQWSSPSFITFIGSTTSPTVTFYSPISGSVDMTVTATNAQGCSAQGRVYMAIWGQPLNTFSSVPANVCASGTGTISVYPNSLEQFNWAVTDGDVVSGQGTNSLTFSPHAGAASVTIQVTITELGCPKTIQQVIPVAGQTPVITTSGPTAFCAGGSVTLTSSIAGSYLWSNGATTQSITVNAAGNYSVTTTDSGCSATSAATTVTVNPLPAPAINASGPTTFCAGGSVTLTASSASSYLWSNGATTQSIVVNAAGNYSVAVTDANGCSATSAATTVTVNALPAPAISTSGATTFCAGGSVTLTASAASSYLWSNGATTQAIVVNASGNYSVAVTDSNGCSATSAATTVTVNPLPVANVDIPSGICSGTTGHAIVNGSFTSIHWQVSNNAQILGNPNQANVSFRSGNGTPFTVSVTVTNANGCSSTYSSNVVINPLPTPQISGALSICVTDTGSLSVTTPTAGSSWNWFLTNATILGVFDAQGNPNPHGSQITYQPAAAGPISVTVNETNANGCFAQGRATVTANAPAPADFTVAAVCPGATGTASANSNYATYSWSITNGTILSGANAHDVTFRASADVNNQTTLTLTTTSYCVTPQTKTVPWSTIASPSITPGSPTVCPATNGNATVSGSYDSYAWTITNGTIVSGANTNTVTYTAGTSGSVTLTLAVSSGGCSSSGTVNVPIEDVTPPSITASGATTFCTGGSVTLTASSASSYLWSNGATTQAITVNASGNYSVTATNANGCSATSAATNVTVNPLPTPTISASGATTFCASGSVMLTASSASSYLWSNGATTQAITVNASGNYSVTATNANGCSATSAATSVTVNPLPTPTISASGATTFCAGGSVTLTASSASSYLWSNGATTQAITANASGNYSVTVTDANGCSATSVATGVTVNPLPTPTISASGSTTFCSGGNVTLTASSASSYLWSNGATTQSTIVSASGNYSVTVTDSNGCSATSQATTVTAFALPAPTISASGATTFCAGGSVTLTASSASSYLWSNGATTQAITVGASGNYSVTVTDANGCSATSVATGVTVNPLPTPTISASGSTTFCSGGNVTLTASSASSYLWSNGATTQSTIVSASGNYSVTVTDSNGCSATSQATTVTAFALPAPTISASGSTTFCSGGSVTLTASSASSYLWSSGATTQAIDVGASGSYSVTVTDANGCSATSAATSVTVNSNPSPSITAPAAICAGATGSASTTAISGASYVWTITNGTITSGAGTSAITFTSSSGPVTLGVTVTTSSSCSGSANATVNVNALPNATITAPSAICSGASASASVPAIAGATYVWTITNGTITSGSGTNAVTFTSTSGPVSLGITVTSSSNCSSSANASVNVNALPNATITAPSSICSSASASASVASVAGATYAWTITNGTITSGNGTSAITFTSASGPVSLGITVTSSSNCSSSANATVNVNALPDATITAPSAICSGGSGSASVASVAGATYAWTITNGTVTSGSGTNAITFTSASGPVSLGITVTTSSNCSASANSTVNVNALPNATITAPTAICSGGSGSASVASVAGATYAWTITNGTITSGSGTNAITFTSTSGPVSLGVTVTSSSCSSSANASVNVNALPNATITAPAAICSGGSGSASVASVAGATYAWTITNGTITSGSGTNAITFTSASGPVSLGITVTTSSNCSSSANASVNVNALPNATITAPSAICSGASASASVATVAGATYAWTITNGTITAGNGTNAITFTSSSGPVSLGVTVTSNGCSSNGSKSVTVNPQPDATITAPSAICSGSTGSASVTAISGGSYAWSITGGTITGGSGTNAITFTATSGTVSLSVSVAANGCSSSGNKSVAVNANPTTPTITPGGATTFCQGGSVTLSAPASSGYHWSDGETTQSIVVSTNGTYTVTVTNGSGCTSAQSAPVTVTVNPATTISQQPQSITITHNTHTTLSVTAAGTGTLTYQWYNPPTANNNDTSKKVGSNSPTFTTPNLAKGPYYYYVTVTSSCGTVRSAIATVTWN